MKNIMAITMGLLLLVSAVAAVGNSNVANVAVTENMADQVMTNAIFAQASDIDASLVGNSILADQITNIDATGNILTGSKPDGKTLFIQSVDQLINDTGNSNVDTQSVGGINIAFVTGINLIDSGLIAAGNTLTDSAASQIIGQSEMIEGNNNVDTQSVGGTNIALVTGISSIDSGLVATGNTLTDSAASQIIGQSEMIEGNNNLDIQSIGGTNLAIVTGISSIDSGLIAADNTLTDSVVNQIIGQSEMVEGNGNFNTQSVGGTNIASVTGISSIDSGLIAVDNTMTDSADNQIIGQSEMIEGNSNVDIQSIGGTNIALVTGISSINSGLVAAGNTLTGSVVNQIIGQSEMVEGNSNFNTQSVGGTNLAIVTGISSINSGLIAVDNTMTDSAARQIISQNDTNIGNTNVVTQIANSIMVTDILTKAGTLQKIDENVHSLGNANTISQDEALTSTANTVTGGNVIQQADVFTSI